MTDQFNNRLCVFFTTSGIFHVFFRFVHSLIFSSSSDMSIKRETRHAIAHKSRLKNYLWCCFNHFPPFLPLSRFRFKSVKTGRGPLVGPDWKKSVSPVMTCYKLVTCEFKWFGLQGRVESFIQKSERRLFTTFHRQVFCWTDKWYGLTMEDIRALEDKTKEELDRQRQSGEVRGMRADED